MTPVGGALAPFDALTGFGHSSGDAEPLVRIALAQKFSSLRLSADATQLEASGLHHHGFRYFDGAFAAV